MKLKIEFHQSMNYCYQASHEESLELRRHIMDSKLEKIDEVFNDQDFYLHEIHRKHQNHQENKTE